MTDPRLLDFINSLIRSKEGYIILEGYYHKEEDEYTLNMLNAMYKHGTITAEILKSIPVTQDQINKFEEESDRIEYLIERYERRLERR
jgi:hypothetical protein